MLKSNFELFKNINSNFKITCQTAEFYQLFIKWKHNQPEIINFFVICAILHKFT